MTVRNCHCGRTYPSHHYTGCSASGCVRLRGRIKLNFSTTYAVDCGVYISKRKRRGDRDLICYSATTRYQWRNSYGLRVGKPAGTRAEGAPAGCPFTQAFQLILLFHKGAPFQHFPIVCAKFS